MNFSCFPAFLRSLTAIIAVSLLMLSLPTLAQQPANQGAQTLQFIQAEMPEVPPVSRTAAIYLKIKNLTDQAIVLNSIETEIARHAMFHQSLEQNGIAKMQHLDQLVIPANQTLELKQGGAHIMLMGIKQIPDSKQFKLYLGNSKQRYQVLIKVIARS